MSKLADLGHGMVFLYHTNFCLMGIMFQNFWIENAVDEKLYQGTHIFLHKISKFNELIDTIDAQKPYNIVLEHLPRIED